MRRCLLIFLVHTIAIGVITAAEPIDLVRLGMGQPLDPALTPALVDVADVAGLPRVLLIGDSISIGYTLRVRELLKGQANVHRPPENAGPTVYGLNRIDAWLGDGKWAVIHFNFGLHDLKYLDEKGTYVSPDEGRQLASVADYEKNLEALVTRLQRTGARLIFATTTPVPAGTIGRVEHGELPYNEAALRVMRAHGIAIDDLHAYVKVHQAEIQQPHNVHFTPAGYEVLAREVATSISLVLKSAPSP
ncbi:MAG: SGNH/GDSL hydrolase family protein [Opitutus sp.]